MSMSMTPADKKKLGIALGAFALAVVLIAWNLFSGPARPSAADTAAQEKVLQSMPDAGAAAAKPPAEPQNQPAPAQPAGPPAGRPRSVRGGG